MSSRETRTSADAFANVTRIVVDRDGLGVTPERAKRLFDIEPDVVFIRDDGWMLAAPREFEQIAFEMWRDKWVAFAHRACEVIHDINSYRQKGHENK